MPSGRYMRHDPPGRRVLGGRLQSCPGSLERAANDDGSTQHPLFYVDIPDTPDDDGLPGM